MNTEVIFKGWLKGYEDLPPEPLFDHIIDGHRHTKGFETLKKEGLDIPAYPTYETWLETYSRAK
jgi:hypothetical protein